jgi:hypothetical protein
MKTGRSARASVVGEGGDKEGADLVDDSGLLPGLLDWEVGRHKGLIRGVG